MANDSAQQSAEPTTPQTPEVRISTAGKALTLSVKLKRPRGDKVKWTAEPGGGPWRITFDKGDGTPFREARFDVPANDSVTTDVGEETAEAKKYHYRVRRGTRPFDETHDPDVDVE